MSLHTDQWYNPIKNFITQPETEVDTLNATLDSYLDTAITFVDGNCSELLHQLKESANETVEEFVKLLSFPNNSIVDVDLFTQCERELSSSTWSNITSSDLFDTHNKTSLYNSTYRNITENDSDLRIFIERPEEMLHLAKINPGKSEYFSFFYFSTNTVFYRFQHSTRSSLPIL